jgi:hypothetical protein
MDAPPQKRAKFSPNACRALLASKGRLPDLSKLSKSVQVLPASQAVRDQFRFSPKFVGIDIETHALVPPSKSPAWRTDEFGILVKASEEALAYLRIVQLGWTYSCEGAPVIKTKLIKPVGFAVEPGATVKHRISHEEALENGVPIRDALCDLFSDVTRAISEGHRLCAHHLGFDAGIILREMERAGLNSYVDKWVQVVGGGLCTMDPSIGHWVRQQIGAWDVPRNIPLRLRDAIAFLLPDSADLLSHHHHAGNDAHMHVLFAQELHRRANL